MPGSSSARARFACLLPHPAREVGELAAALEPRAQRLSSRPGSGRGRARPRLVGHRRGSAYTVGPSTHTASSLPARSKMHPARGGQLVGRRGLRLAAGRAAAVDDRRSAPRGGEHGEDEHDHDSRRLIRAACRRRSSDLTASPPARVRPRPPARRPVRVGTRLAGRGQLELAAHAPAARSRARRRACGGARDRGARAAEASSCAVRSASVLLLGRDLGHRVAEPEDLHAQRDEQERGDEAAAEQREREPQRRGAARGAAARREIAADEILRERFLARCQPAQPRAARLGAARRRIVDGFP